MALFKIAKMQKESKGSGIEKDVLCVQVPQPGRGGASYTLKCGDDFFAAVGHPDMLGGEVEVKVNLMPAGDEFRLRMKCDGYVVTACDRCMGALQLPVHEDYEVPVSVGVRMSDIADDDPDSLHYNARTGALDLERVIADTLALSLPLRKVHDAGECDPEMSARLQDMVRDEDDEC